MSITKTVHLICCEVETNNNKYWKGELHDNDDVYLEWGRVGKAPQSQTNKGVGEKFLLKKEREKLKKGYTPLETIAVDKSNTTTTITVVDDIKSIAHSQIKTGSNTLADLIDKLVVANIHQITSNTQIKYDAQSGMFTTPLGIVTPDAIKRARGLLLQIKNCKSGLTLKQIASSYLRIIPQDVGMKFDMHILFGTNQAIEKQNDLLDSLEASYTSFTKVPTQTAKQTANGTVPTTPSIFNITLDLLKDPKEFDRIKAKYNATRKSMHSASVLDLKNVYVVDINTVSSAFQYGKKVGNVQELWHGTKKANLLSIFKTGLKISPPSTASIAGAMFSRGLYFSDQSTKSLNYAYGYWDNTKDDNCFMFLCDVAMGKSYTPPSPSQDLPKPGYDSTYAIGGKSGVVNNEMIVYKEEQVNLKYLCEFSK